MPAWTAPPRMHMPKVEDPILLSFRNVGMTE
jgi:hypothetical protein